MKFSRSFWSSKDNLSIYAPFANYGLTIYSVFQNKYGTKLYGLIKSNREMKIPRKVGLRHFWIKHETSNDRFDQPMLTVLQAKSTHECFIFLLNNVNSEDPDIKRKDGFLPETSINTQHKFSLWEIQGCVFYNLIFNVLC